MCNCTKCKQQVSALVPELETLLQESEYGMPGEYQYENDYETMHEDEYEYEDKLAEVAPRSKMKWVHNTNLNAACPWGRFNFLYNSGAAEAWITFNTQVVYKQSYTPDAKKDFIKNLCDAAAIWDKAAEIQIKDKRGNYSTAIKLRFKVECVTDAKNMNKRTEVFPPGSKATSSTLPNQEAVDKELNVFIGSSAPVLAHELGHVWGLPDEYTYTKKKGLLEWLTIRRNNCHVGNKSPLVNDTKAIMNYGINITGEFRTRYFLHFAKAILNSFWNVPDHVIPVIHNGKVVSRTIECRVALLKKDMTGAWPYGSDQPFNPQFAEIKMHRRA
jgi:hypothetical protein